MSSRTPILLVDRDPQLAAQLCSVLRDRFEVIFAASAEEALAHLQLRPSIAIVLAGVSLRDGSGLEFLHRVQLLHIQIVRMLLAPASTLSALEAPVTEGRIHRVVVWPWDENELRLQVIEAMNHHLLLKERVLLQELAVTDPVTHLRNHRFFQDQLKVEVERACRYNRPMSVIMADIDRFKAFNDRFGHVAGDEVLFWVGQELSNQSRSSDTVARYGGEEFALILPETENEHAMSIAERIRARVEILKRPIQDGTTTSVTISLGVASFPLHAVTASAMIRAADRALYLAKGRGRNQAVSAERIAESHLPFESV